MKKLNINECHNILLSIMKDIHTVCVNNDIPYYMLGGSMLGAIRHNGFIPWDDDLDIGIERKYYNKFIECARKELPEDLLVSTYKDSKGIMSGFAKVQNTKTLVIEPIYRVKDEYRNGISIDIFPLDYSSKDLKGYKLIRSILKTHILLFVDSTHPTVFNNVLRGTMRLFLSPIKKNTLISLIDTLINKYNRKYQDSADCLISYWSQYGSKTLCSKSIWGVPKLYKFEDTSFYGPEKGTEYLESLFNDFMTLPPIEKRIVHFENIYLK